MRGGRWLSQGDLASIGAAQVGTQGHGGRIGRLVNTDIRRCHQVAGALRALNAHATGAIAAEDLTADFRGRTRITDHCAA